VGWFWLSSEFCGYFSVSWVGFSFFFFFGGRGGFLGWFGVLGVSGRTVLTAEGLALLSPPLTATATLDTGLHSERLGLFVPRVLHSESS